MEENTFTGTEEYPLFPPTSDEKTLAVLSHALTLIPGVGFLAPLIIYLIKRDESEFVALSAKESLNFQITLIIVVLVLFLTVIGIFLVWIVAILALILVILASIKTSEGKIYRYPLTLRLIR